ncbi:MAG: ABC transporter permease [Armatimonadetes bacterium]|nr:ABC transporter permease [Armatimonadota bacterium]
MRVFPGRELGHLLHNGTYLAAEGWTAFRRNGLMSLAALTTALVMQLTLGGGLVAFLNLRHLTDQIEGRVEVVAFLRDGLSPRARAALRSSIAGLPQVAEARLVSKEVALRRLQSAFGGRVSFADLLQAIPLPDSLVFRVHEPREVRAVAEAVRRIPEVEEVVFGAQAVDRLFALTGGVRHIAAVAAVVLAAVALVVIINTVRLTIIARREEIEIMRLVGATAWFIRGPFVVEGVVAGALSATVAAAVLVPVYLNAAGRIRVLLPFLPLADPRAVLPGVVVLMLVAGVAVGCAGGVLSVRRFLRDTPAA